MTDRWSSGGCTAAWLHGCMAARLHGGRAELELWRLHRWALRRRDLHGLVLGFAAFTERQIRDAVVALARAIEAA